MHSLCQSRARSIHRATSQLTKPPGRTLLPTHLQWGEGSIARRRLRDPVNTDTEMANPPPQTPTAPRQSLQAQTPSSHIRKLSIGVGGNGTRQQDVDAPKKDSHVPPAVHRAIKYQLLRAPGATSKIDGVNGGWRTAWAKKGGDLEHLSIQATYLNTQPPLINARGLWPDSGTTRLRPANPRDAQNYDACFPDLEPTGRYATDEGGTVDGRTWRDHAMDIRGGLLRFHEAEMATNFYIQAMLTVLGQGIEHAVYVMNRELITVTGSTPWLNGTDDQGLRDPRFEAHTTMIDAELPSPSATEAMGRGIHMRRFIATVINYKPNRHWVAVVFDRLFGHLYILDTLGPSNKARARRAANITRAWRQFGANLGFLTSIVGILPPLALQVDDWSCGYLAIINLTLMLRGLVGWQHLAPFNRQRQVSTAVDGDEHDDARKSGASPAFHIPDWSCGAPTAEDGMKRASALINAMMCNELGIINSDELARALGRERPPEQPHFVFQSAGMFQPMIWSISGVTTGPASTQLTYIFNPATMYSPAGGRLTQGLGPLGTRTVPPSFPEPDAGMVSALRRSPYESYAALVRTNVICWNRDEEQYQPPVIHIPDTDVELSD